MTNDETDCPGVAISERQFYRISVVAREFITVSGWITCGAEPVGAPEIIIFPPDPVCSPGPADGYQ